MKKIYLLLALFCLCIVVSATTVRVNGSPLNNGVTFTSSNLSVIKEGSISWDATKHELTLLNLTMECTNSTAIKVSNTDDVKIVLKGTSTINVSGAVDGIVLEGDSAYSIVYNNDYGLGKLTVTTTGKYSDGSVKSTCAAISTNSTLSFDKVKVYAYGPCGIRCNGTGSINFTSSTVQARGLNGGSILGFEKATLTKY